MYGSKWGHGDKGSSCGTGYGGDAKKDKIKRHAEKKRASEAEKKWLIELEKRMKAGHNQLSSSEPPSPALLSDIREVIRNQVPDQWSCNYSLYKAALDCCHLLSIHHARSLGASDDPEAIVYAMNDFAQHADMILKHDTMNHGTIKKLATTIIEVHKIALAASSSVFQPQEMAVMDPHEYYREALRPLRFELVPGLKGHAFEKCSQNSRLDLKKIFRELTAYKTALPIEFGSSVFVRAVESRLDLLRACITGPEDTPYANGAFIFDIYLSDYPRKPPQVKYITTGGGKFRFNPNLYADGKVCLSLLGTWSGPGWNAGESTLLQVLISIQSLILVNDPYFNEPGYQALLGTQRGTSGSIKYNNKIRSFTLQACILPFLPKSASPSPGSYPEFDEVLQRHFRNKRPSLQKQLYQWYTKDQSLQKLYMQFLDIVEQNHPRRQLRRAANLPAVIEAKEADGVIEIGGEDNDYPNQKPRIALRLPAVIETKEVDGVIEIREDKNEPSPRSKKRKQRDVIILDDDKETDLKPAATIMPSKSSSTAHHTSSASDIVIDLT
mmetsp:Transcript_9187/g.13412  ORF Transcript_9187/g.13412 Transcript_9187/m.13412 type:complete len:553 (-) Transcript_9187:83-1741(-)